MPHMLYSPRIFLSVANGPLCKLLYASSADSAYCCAAASAAAVVSAYPTMVASADLSIGFMI